MKSIAFTLLLLWVAHTAHGQSRNVSKGLDKLLHERYQEVAPGCAVLVARKGQVIYEKAFGKANLELNVPMRPEMEFRVASITKQYTAVAVLQLVERGVISLQDSIQRFIKEFPPKGYTITIEHLLTQTSGIKGYEQFGDNIPNVVRLDFPIRAIVDSLARVPLDFQPGTRFAYSNSNYFLLGYIIEQASHQSYQQYITENLFRPAGLRATFYDVPTAIIPNRVNGYAQHNNQYQNADYLSMSVVYSAGALLATASDLFRWHQALYAGKLLKLTTLTQATTPARLVNGTTTEYGYGWFVRTSDGIRNIGHAGAIDGFRSIEAYLPEHDVFIAALFNSENEAYVRLYQEIEKIVLGKSTHPVIEAKLNEALLDTYAGIYRNDEYKVTIKLYKAEGHLYGDLSNGTGSHLLFLAKNSTQFSLPDIKRVPTTAEFVVENGRPTKLILTQEAEFSFNRIE